MRSPSPSPGAEEDRTIPDDCGARHPTLQGRAVRHPAGGSQGANGRFGRVNSRCGEVFFLNVACGPEKSDNGRFITQMAYKIREHVDKPWDFGIWGSLSFRPNHMDHMGTPNFFASEKLATSGILLR